MELTFSKIWGENTMNTNERNYSGTLSSVESKREIRHKEIARMAAAEGIVLLENNGILPLSKNEKLALYGSGARYTVKGGTGSGAVNNRANISIDQGLRNAGFKIQNQAWLDDYDHAYAEAKELWIKQVYESAGPGEDFERLYRAFATHTLKSPRGKTITKDEKADAEIAIFVISRISGEGADRKAEKGDYYLSEDEEQVLTEITEVYARIIVVLNVGGVMDLSFLERFKIDALVYLSQAGMEGGNALADVLSGAVNPSGRLTDTWAYHYSDYPSSAEFSHNNGNIIEEFYNEGIYVGYRYFDTFQVKVRYPFGYGKSYTSFSKDVKRLWVDNGRVNIELVLVNTGKVAGKEVVFLYVSCPDGKLIKELKRLVDFSKTDLMSPGETRDITLSFSLSQLESYHSGTGCYLLEKGEYQILLGGSAEEAELIDILKLEQDVITAELDNVCPLWDALKEIKPNSIKEAANIKAISLNAEDVPKREVQYCNPKSLIGDGPYAKLAEQLSVEEAAKLCCGHPGEGNQEIIGAASFTVPGAAGETTPILKEKYGIGNIVLADGPAGLRLISRYEVNPEDGTIYKMNRYEGLENRFFAKEFRHEGATAYYQYCTAIPIGTLLAQSFDLELMKEIGRLIGREMEAFGITLWLAPGMNIHRDPLCGRNFEYYSEDPLLSGKMAAALTKGVQENPSVGTCIKHFVCNNQEENRRGVSSIVSERALREIYLKGFEIAIKESQPRSIMTSYNKVNGVHTANSYDLCTKVARDEWGFDGIIMTDWMTTNAGGGSSAAKCLEAGNDLVMPGTANDISEIINAVHKEECQNLDEKALRRCAARMIRIIHETGN